MILLPVLKVSYGPPKPQVILLAVLRVPFTLLPYPWIWIVQCIGTGLVLYGFMIEPQRLVVSQEYLSTKKLHDRVRLRFLHIGDLHIEKMAIREGKVIQAVKDLKPDFILFSGDILSYSTVDDPGAYKDAKTVFNELCRIAEVYAVQGSPPVDIEDVLLSVYADTEVTLLDSQRLPMAIPGARITLTGLSCSHVPEYDSEVLRKLGPIEPDDFNILLFHSPDLAPSAAKSGYDLQLSGHTHGGQVRLPFYGAIYTSSLEGKRYEMGRYQIGDMTLYVTRGIGMEGKAAPRVRFLSPPELTIWEISGCSS
jgi:predicted MPP superfamily phosphohydrolase